MRIENVLNERYNPGNPKGDELMRPTPPVRRVAPVPQSRPNIPAVPSPSATPRMAGGLPRVAAQPAPSVSLPSPPSGVVFPEHHIDLTEHMATPHSALPQAFGGMLGFPSEAAVSPGSTAKPARPSDTGRRRGRSINRSTYSGPGASSE